MAAHELKSTDPVPEHQPTLLPHKFGEHKKLGKLARFDGWDKDEVVWETISEWVSDKRLF